MASQAKIMGSVTTTVRFLTDRLKSEIMENSNPNNLNLSQTQLNALMSMVENSIQESYNRSMDQIIRSIEE